MIDGWTTDESRPGAGPVSSQASASGSPASTSGDDRGGGGAGGNNGNLSDESLPVLLQRAVNKVKELDNGEVYCCTSCTAEVPLPPRCYLCVLLEVVLQSAILPFVLLLVRRFKHPSHCVIVSLCHSVNRWPRPKAAALQQLSIPRRWFLRSFTWIEQIEVPGPGS